MLTIINIGNTNTNWGIATSEKDVQSVNTEKTTTDKSVIKKEFEKISSQGKIDGVVIGSVVPDACAAVREVAKEFCPEEKIIAPTLADFKKIMPIEVKKKIVSPGADRLANALALKKFYKLPAASVDFGTAITIEVVDENGALLGGVIMPSEKLQLKALQDYTAQLDAIKELPDVDFPIGQTTAEAIAAGIKPWILTSIVMILSNMEEVFNAPLANVVITGGDAKRVYKKMKEIFYEEGCMDELLTLRGLAAAYKLLV